MTDDQETALQTSQWCLGLPLVAEEPLTGEEQAQLRREKLHGRLGCCGLALVLPVLFITFIIGMVIAMEQTHELGPLGWVGTLLCFGLLALVKVIASDYSRRASNATIDAKAGVKLRFVGVIPPYAFADSSARKLLKCQAIQHDTAATQELVILPASQRIWSANGKRVRPYVIVTCGITTNPPAYLHIAAQWLDPVSQPDAPVELFLGQRELSVEEQAEIQVFVRQLWTQPLPWALIFTTWSVIIIILCILAGRWPSPGQSPFFYLLLLITCLNDLWWLSQTATAIRLHRDSKKGIALILRIQQAISDAADENDAAPKEHVLEVLPESRIIWTVDLAPSPWRKMNVRFGVKKPTFWRR